MAYYGKDIEAYLEYAVSPVSVNGKHFQHAVYCPTIDLMQYALSEPGLSAGDRMFIGYLCGVTHEPSKGFEGT